MRTERRRLPDAPMGEFRGLFHRQPLGCAVLLPLRGALLPGALAFLACSQITQESRTCKAPSMPVQLLTVCFMQLLWFTNTSLNWFPGQEWGKSASLI